MATSPAALFLLLLAVGALILGIHLELLSIAFHKLGLSRVQAGIVLLASIIGSFVNLPLFRLRGIPPDQIEYPPDFKARPNLVVPYEGVTVVAVNVGGCLVPISLSIFLVSQTALSLDRILLGIGLVTLVSFISARPIPSVGIGMPMFVAPLAALLAGVLFGAEERALAAYVAGTTGVLVGADILRLDYIRQTGVANASIGGAGTFDGIFFTGIFAVLIA